MHDRDDEANVLREPWKRLLEDTGDGPPETTDARIRAAARRDLSPRGRRWWLPASLAASFVLAVLIVRSEIGGGGRVPIFATERGGNEAMDARIIDRHEGEQAREPGESPTAPSPQRAKQRKETESDAYGYADSELGQEAAGTGPRVGGPERELKSASEMPEEAVPRIDFPALASDEASGAAAQAPAAAQPAEKANADLGKVIVSGSQAPPPSAGVASRESSWTPTHVAAPGAGATPPAPEDWYAAIEKLRREGRTAEADRELERLKKAYPGWLEQHLKAQPPP
jgi:hypothetical protein